MDRYSTISVGAAVNRDARLQLILFMLAIQHPSGSDAETNTVPLSSHATPDTQTEYSQLLNQGELTLQTDSCR